MTFKIKYIIQIEIILEEKSYIFDFKRTLLNENKKLKIR